MQTAEEERLQMSLAASCQQLPEGIYPVEHPGSSQGACRSASRSRVSIMIAL